MIDYFLAKFFFFHPFMIKVAIVWALVTDHEHR